MSGVSDGATTRRERLFDLLQYVRGFMPRGLTITQIQMYMSIAHGLTYKTSGKYIYELQTGQMLTIKAGMVLLREDNFKKIINTQFPERDPETGYRQDFVYGDVELLKTPQPSPEIQEINKKLEAEKGLREETFEALMVSFSQDEMRFKELHKSMVEMEYYDMTERTKTLGLLEKAIRKGLIERISRGLYRKKAEGVK